jgi:hypothetical protein
MPTTKLNTGVDVMTTIFGEFPQFLEKKLAFFLETDVMIQILQKIAVF